MRIESWWDELKALYQDSFWSRYGFWTFVFWIAWTLTPDAQIKLMFETLESNLSEDAFNVILWTSVIVFAGGVIPAVAYAIVFVFFICEKKPHLGWLVLGVFIGAYAVLLLFGLNMN